MTLSPLADELRRIVRNEVRVREPMARHTSFRIGGPAELFAVVESAEELSGLLKFARKQDIALFFLGNGTNLLVSDEGIPGLVITLGDGFKGISIDGTEVRVGAAEHLARLAHRAAEMGLSGLEFASTIPGTVGGGVAMNAGAYGGSIDQVIREVRVMSPDGVSEVWPARDMQFGYRTSRLQGTGAIVLEAALTLTPGQPEEINKVMAEHLARRRASQPLAWPNAGSIFRNPSGQSAGRLIDEAGGKGLREGEAQVSPLHANFIVNLGSATARDVLNLMTRVRELVLSRSGVVLEPEIKIWGPNEYFPGAFP